MIQQEKALMAQRKKEVESIPETSASESGAWTLNSDEGPWEYYTGSSVLSPPSFSLQLLIELLWKAEGGGERTAKLLGCPSCSEAVAVALRSPGRGAAQLAWCTQSPHSWWIYFLLSRVLSSAWLISTCEWETFFLLPLVAQDFSCPLP